jgi:hypothetical protein
VRKAACRELTQSAAGPGDLPRRSRVCAARGHRPVSDRKTGFIEHGPGEPDRRAVGARSNDRNGAECGRGAGGAAATPGRGSAATTVAPFAQRDGAVLGSARAVTSGAEGVAAPDWAESAHRRRNGSAERNGGRPSGTVCGRITEDVATERVSVVRRASGASDGVEASDQRERWKTDRGSVACERPTGALEPIL